MTPARSRRWLACLAVAPIIASASPEAIEELAARLPGLGADAIAQLAEEHLESPLTPHFERAWWNLVFYRWCETDRTAAGTFASADEQRVLLYDFLKAAWGQDPGGAEEAAAALGKGAERLLTHFRQEIGVEGDAPPPAAVDLVAALENTRRSDDRHDRIAQIQELIGAGAKAHPEAMYAQINSIEDKEDRALLFEAFFESLPESEPEAAARVYAQLEPSIARSKMAPELAYNWAREDGLRTAGRPRSRGGDPDQ